ncbi:hypothetical protein [Aeromonas hydrophila]|nr:hypothetical protein [Aeromonas hydrophila]
MSYMVMIELNLMMMREEWYKQQKMSPASVELMMALQEPGDEE